MGVPPEATRRRARSLRRWWALTSLVAVAAIAVVIALSDHSPPGHAPIGSTIAAERAGEPPFDAGGTYLCRADAPYAAYEAYAHRFFPPNHPAHPPLTIRPDRCFASAGDAESAGFVLASPPQGGWVVDGLYLVPVDLFHVCDGAAHRLGFTVICPNLLPNPAPGADAPSCRHRTELGRSGCVFQRSFVFEYAGFAVPPRFALAGGFGPREALVIAAYLQGDRGHDEEFDYFVTCSAATVRDRMLVHPLGDRTRMATLLSCPTDVPLPQGGQLIARWVRDGITYDISVTGDSATSRDVLQAVIGAMSYVPANPKPRTFTRHR